MRGIDKFKERFAGHDGEYVLIGGGACDLLFGEAGQDFRATKDLDLVLLVEALTPEFGRVFWDFVKEGGYENRQKSSGKPQFYRFSKPEDPAFPARGSPTRRSSGRPWRASSPRGSIFTRAATGTAGSTASSGATASSSARNGRSPSCASWGCRRRGRAGSANARRRSRWATRA